MDGISKDGWTALLTERLCSVQCPRALLAIQSQSEFHGERAQV